LVEQNGVMTGDPGRLSPVAAAALRGATVRVQVRYQNGTTNGEGASGVVIQPGLVLTAAHVVTEARTDGADGDLASIRVFGTDGRSSQVADGCFLLEDSSVPTKFVRPFEVDKIPRPKPPKFGPNGAPVHNPDEKLDRTAIVADKDVAVL